MPLERKNLTSGKEDYGNTVDTLRLSYKEIVKIVQAKKKIQKTEVCCLIRSVDASEKMDADSILCEEGYGELDSIFGE